METLVVKNFLNIKKIELNIGEFTLLIGPQAAGKSIIAKLIYFFKLIPSVIQGTIIDDGTRRDVNKKLESIFSEIFPAYSWENSIFEIVYLNESFSMIISTSGRKKKKTLQLRYSKELTNKINSIRRGYKKIKLQIEEKGKNQTKKRFYFDSKYQIKSEMYKYSKDLKVFFNQGFEKPVFIPSGRSFFSTLQNNVFTFLSNNLNIDYFLKEFGSVYDRIKSIFPFVEKGENLRNGEIEKFSREVLKGSFIQREKKEYIKSSVNGMLTNIENASSGQQEALPMLFVLSTLPFLSADEKNCYFVEEPEAHLFPESQKTVLDMLATLFNRNKGACQYVITTHSPYILSTLNVYLKAGIMAEYYLEKENGEGLERLSKIVPENTMLSSNSTRAYEVNEGNVKDIIDTETGLIDDEIIDRVSYRNSYSFDEMLEMEII